MYRNRSNFSPGGRPERAPHADAHDRPPAPTAREVLFEAGLTLGLALAFAGTVGVALAAFGIH